MAVVTISVATIRQRVAEAVDAIDGWSLSRWVGESIDRETDDRLHRCAAVEVTASEPVGGGPPQVREQGAWTTSTVVVHWRYRLRADAHVSDYDTALRDEQRLIVASENASLRRQIELRWERSERNLNPSGEWLVGRITLRALHVSALSNT